ncbi:MAG TPA: sulfatase-like hydrolase/transferase [Vicinamibacterales bacterium]
MRRRALASLSIVPLLFGAWACRRPSPRPAHDPGLNVLLITIDTLRADALGAYGNGRTATPLMDRLAAAGVRFDRAHAHSVVTLPSHASILSGLYPQDHGVRDNAGFRFPAAQATLATLLKARGYATGAFVSAFPLASRFGLMRGFAIYDDGFVDAAPRAPMLEQERRGTETVALARRWLDRHASERTFCWVHLYEPHAPYAPPEPFASRFQADPYLGEVAATDAALEPLLRPVLDAGERGRTAIVLTADHGEALGDHGEATHGVFAYESTLRVPLVVYVPALLSPRVVSTEARHVDIVPTILDVLGVAPPEDLRGASLLPAARGETVDPHTVTYFESLSPALNRGWAPLRGLVRDGVKYIDLPLPELYDLAVDPQEERNAIAARAPEASALRRLLGSATFAGAAAPRIAESAEARARLESLGYTSGGAPARDRYTEKDDPKRLIAIDAQLQEVVRLYTSGDRATALERARALVREQPEMRVAWMTLAQVQHDGGDLDGAIASLRRAHALGPRDPQTSALLGGYLTERGAATEAIAVLTPPATDAGADQQVLVALALAQARAGRGGDAVATLDRARAADPSNAMLLVDLGTIRLMANQRDEARRAFDDAVSRNPGIARAHGSLAAMAAEEGRADDAIAEWRVAAQIDPAEYGRVFLLGVSFARTGRPAAARACFGFIVDSAPASRYEQQIGAAREWLTRNR